MANFPRSNANELTDKNIEILGRSESNLKNQSRLEKHDSSISVAMLNAEPSSFM